MAFSRQFFLVSLLLFPNALTPLCAQRLNPGQNHLPQLNQQTRKAGYIFEGTVLSIAPVNSPSGVAANQITFRIDVGFRGVQTGQTLAIREWAGLWDNGEHYRVGERVALFLYAPSKLGLTSPVGGPLGHLAIDSNGFVHLPEAESQTPEGDGAPRRRVSSREFAASVRRSLE